MSIRITLHDSEVDMLQVMLAQWKDWLASPGQASGAHAAAGRFTRYRVAVLLEKIETEKAKAEKT